MEVSREQVREKAVRSARRVRKARAIRRLARHEGDPLIVFEVGCQRSGTTRLGEVIDRSLDTWVYHEHDQRAFRDLRLRTAEVDRLARGPGRPVAVFTPLVDSQWTDRFLDRHPGSKAIWIYRRYPDVARSAISAWGDHQRRLIDGVRRRQLAQLGWRGERLADHVVATIDHLHRPDLSVQEGAALFWWMRNSILWDRGLEDDERVLVVRYEDLVTDPTPAVERVFRFLGVSFDDALVTNTTSASVSGQPLDHLHPDITSLCDTMQRRLDGAHERSLVRVPRRSAVPA